MNEKVLFVSFEVVHFAVDENASVASGQREPLQK
jgi:hypothetical protein